MTLAIDSSLIQLPDAYRRAIQVWESHFRDESSIFLAVLDHHDFVAAFVMDDLIHERVDE